MWSINYGQLLSCSCLPIWQSIMHDVHESYFGPTCNATRTWHFDLFHRPSSSFPSTGFPVSATNRTPSPLILRSFPSKKTSRRYGNNEETQSARTGTSTNELWTRKLLERIHRANDVRRARWASGQPADAAAYETASTPIRIIVNRTAAVLVIYTVINYSCSTCKVIHLWTSFVCCCWTYHLE